MQMDMRVTKLVHEWPECLKICGIKRLHIKYTSRDQPVTHRHKKEEKETTCSFSANCNRPLSRNRVDGQQQKAGNHSRQRPSILGSFGSLPAREQLVKGAPVFHHHLLCWIWKTNKWVLEDFLFIIQVGVYGIVLG
ncbi:hypothetical protein CDAR_472811 [Caerostris darwini]|uniref:Uncharacterized protein n=1 Tax=Caerostris darwini TaxID=1538125 RepID=A0AAV4V8W6_9ARAC|nr:hypothetical protein CDAR_472811 [Caerostris darwini]